MPEFTLYEVMCRGPAKCGTFVSARKPEGCPKCRGSKVLVRPVRDAG